tara:strand:+ start:1551 stop:1760 length:210 start_codon:yes stop_codon:yes gene_type:complete
MTPEEIEKEVKEVCSWSTASGVKKTRLYNIHKIIYNDPRRYCHKCPGVVRWIFNRVKQYKLKNYEKETI